MTDTTFSISTKATSYRSIWIQSPSLHDWLYTCPRYSINPRFGSANDRTTCFILWIERDDFTWYQSHSIHWTKQVEYRSSFQTDGFSDFRSLSGYGKWNIRHNVENGNDFTYLVETRRDRPLLVIGVCNLIGRSYIVEHRLLGLNRTITKII